MDLKLDELVSFCKRRGFVYQSSSLYGGLQGFFDYGPLGVELKNNIRKYWWKENVYLRDDVYGLDSALVLHQSVVNYSGHADTFTDDLIDCYDCKMRFRDDELLDNNCPYCKSQKLSQKRAFNLMMSVPLGPTGETHGILRPETAQSVFINYKNICDSFNPKIPFGIAQTGKAFRNEITPRNFIFRMREFEQMEIEYFVHPSEAKTIFNDWLKRRVSWWGKLGLKDIKTYCQQKNELAHYSQETVDILFKFSHGWEELEGVANRSDFDLGSHSKCQNEFQIMSQVKKNNDSVDKLYYGNNEKFIPHIVESSSGLDRAFLAILTQAYHKEKFDNEERVVLKLLPQLAPIKFAIVPLAKNNQEIVDYAKKIFLLLKQSNIFPIILESGGNIGKCYRKHDEIGTPFVITIDFESLNEKKDTVTIRDRDTMQQKRLNINDLVAFCNEFFK